jgi:hypothetical protein
VPLYGLDIETDTTVDGLDPACATVVAIGLATPERDEVFLGDEADILRRVDRRLRELPPGVVVTWNGCSFDLPFLAIRAAVCDTPLGLELWCRTGADAGASLPDVCWPPPPQGFGGRWAPHAHLDGYLTYRADVRRSLGLSCGLTAISRLVGLQPVEVDYDQLHTLSDHDLAVRRQRRATGLPAGAAPAAAVLAAVDRPTGERGPLPGLPVAVAG